MNELQGRIEGVQAAGNKFFEEGVAEIQRRDPEFMEAMTAGAQERLKREVELLADFEAPTQDTKSPFDIVSKRLDQAIALKGETFEGIARTENTVRTYILGKYPEAEDRALLARALVDKFFSTKNPEEESDWRKKFNDAFDKYDVVPQASEAYDRMFKQLCHAEGIIELLNRINEVEVERAETAKKETVEKKKIQELIDENKRREEAARAEIREKAFNTFENYKIRVPKRENPDEMTEELSLREYAEGIFKLPQETKEEIKEKQTRIEHLAANMKFALTEIEIQELRQTLSDEADEAREEYQLALKERADAILDHEVVGEEKEALDKKVKETIDIFNGKHRLYFLINLAETVQLKPYVKGAD
jgi:hypothetical protein